MATTKKRTKRGRVVARCWVLVAPKNRYMGRFYVRRGTVEGGAMLLGTQSAADAIEFDSLRVARAMVASFGKGTPYRVFRRGKRGGA
jgi:hypothetical protein